ncbi:hypothetical protein [Thermus sediminis]|uniref:hypothetical protein n=1 Tax=Thermus sediminis TaxID=1761908 RepID=UPI000E3C00C0|nr:hypothetical protein [Thermus sediminis]
MKKALFGTLVLAAGLSLAQGVDYRQAALAAAALARLQALAQAATGEERLLAWAQEVKARAEGSYEARAYFRAFREAQAALYLFRAAQGEPRVQVPARPGPQMGLGQGFVPERPRGWRDQGARRRGAADPVLRLRERAQARVDRAERELDYYRGQDPLVRGLILEARNRLGAEPGRALLLSQAALALISAERGF